MPTERITPQPGCRYCGGSGRSRQPHGERITCQCVLDQITDDDAVIIIEDAFDYAADAAYDEWRDRQ